MAFTGAGTVTSLGTRIVRITDVLLAAAATGTITAFGGGGDVVLPVGFPALATNDVIVSCKEAAVSILLKPLAVAKDSPLTTISIINGDAVNASKTLEIYVKAPCSIES